MSKQANYQIDKSFNDSSKNVKMISENKHRRVADEKYAELEKSLNSQSTNNDELNEGGDPVSTSNDVQKDNKTQAVDWAKRYSDLRSYQTKKEQELQGQINELKTQAAQKSQEVKYPKTEEEIDEWMDKYPEVYAIIKTIAGKTSEEQTIKLATDMEELQKDRARLAYERAYNQLLGFHPDFDEVRNTDAFNEWLVDQPMMLQNAIFKPSLDEAGVKSASRVIDLYKKDMGLEKKTPLDKNTAAKRVVKSSNSDPEKEEANSGKSRWSESRVKDLSTKQFEQFQDEIVSAQREGRFDYDLSGAAR